VVQCSVGVMVVDMRHVLGQHSLERAAIDAQHPVQQCAADRCDPAFGDRIRLGRRHRGAQDVNTLAGEHGIEHPGDRAVAIPDHERALSRAVAEVGQEGAGLLSDPGTARSRRDAQERTLRVACSPTNSTDNR
jgi:hypothetical protein